MPYHWCNVKNAYTNAPDCWQKHDMAIVSDLAWFLIDRDDTPETLTSLAHNAIEVEDWREPLSIEDCLFKTWYDQILVSETSLGYRDSLLQTLLDGEFENLTENQACFVIHLLPCQVIRSFIQHINNQISRDLEQLTQHFEDPQDLNIICYSSSDEYDEEFVSVSEHGETLTQYQDYDSMPELEQDSSDSSDGESDEERDEESYEERDEESYEESDQETDYETDEEDVEYENDIEDVRNEFLQGALTAQEFNEYTMTASCDRTASRPAYIRV